jgi:hypothetical protein
MPVLLSLLLAGSVLGQAAGPPPCGSYLFQPAFALDCLLRGPAVPYQPQPGDIMLCTDFKWVWTVGHDMAGAGHPHHAGIVVGMPDGQVGLLEAGPHDKAYIATAEAVPHLRSYEVEGPVWLRRRRVPLTCEQSARLTEFAMKQEGKRFAVVRMFALTTPIRNRGPVRTYWLGTPKGADRSSYYCAELCMEACVYAGLLDPEKTRPSATFPHDIFMDESLNPFLNKNLKLYPDWDPPARWTGGPGMPARTVQFTYPQGPALGLP